MDIALYPCHAKSLRRAGHARAQLFAHVIEGKRYTTAQVAEILDISHSAAYERIKRRSHPLTWADLQKARMP
ncbi:TPA: hypothetical protein QEL30_000678 [Stenotrophomonas maltophilia]|uniref:hypothetical protein n=1 Tax=Stenotrophomonas maltophilia TaxID=40324 RepID=UPI00066E18CE|nr:hypothetical protein [Stenotrophomonas maltophilia]HDS1595897.1 hypothetical protein [Stenotrophomonas maltophilia]